MNEYEQDGSGSGGDRMHPPMAGTATARDSDAPDLVFDLSGLDRMRVTDLSFLLTARQLAGREERSVWAVGLAPESWRTLHDLGLGRFFKRFPGGDERSA